MPQNLRKNIFLIVIFKTVTEFLCISVSTSILKEIAYFSVYFKRVEGCPCE